MNKLLTKIKEDLCFLPQKDYCIGIRLLNKRDFESLSNLVNSIFIKLDTLTGDSESSLRDLNINKIASLYSNITEYLYYQDISDDLDNDKEEYKDNVYIEQIENEEY